MAGIRGTFPCRRGLHGVLKMRVPFFYGWIIVGITLLGTIQIYGIRHSFSVFFPYILDEFGWDRGSTALMYSLNIGVYGFIAPFVGSLGDRWQPGRVMPLGILFLGLVTAACALARQLWHFYLLFGILVPIGMAFSGWPLLVSALVNWFSSRRALAIGLGNMGIGLSFSYAMFAEFSISLLGWRHVYLVLAALLVGLMLPIYLFLFHYRPEDKGLRPYGLKKYSASGVPTRPEIFAGTSRSLEVGLGETLRSYRLWLLVLSNFFYWGIAAYMVLAHQIKFAEDVGYESMFAASIFAFFGIFMVAGQLSSSISDWIGRETTVLIATILAVGGLIALLSVEDSSQPWLLYAYATSFGCGSGLYAPTMFAGGADIFHGRHYGAVAGLLLTGMGVGGVIGPWLGGYLYDTSGSYFYPFVIAILSVCLACITFIIAAPRKAKDTVW